MVGLTAIGDDEEASSCIGLNIVRYKTAMFVISAAITGVGGILYAQYTMYLNPITMVGAGASLSIVFKSILGGMFTLWGPTIGTLIIIAMEEYVRVFFGAEYIGWSIIGYGITIIILIIFFPQGIYGTLREVLSKRQKHRIY
jgi:branched-chain amino acid transport system permease protein